MPAIRYEQKRGAAVLLALSTGATFFSGVTATMLQISYSVSHNPVITIVNTFWFCSLVLSIGAAINSLLAMVWKQTFQLVSITSTTDVLLTYIPPSGSRGSKLPRWLTWWISGSPPTFLFISIICFSAGIVLFVFASEQVVYCSPHRLPTASYSSFTEPFHFVVHSCCHRRHIFGILCEHIMDAS